MCCSLCLTSTSGTRKRNELTDSAMWTEVEGEGRGLTVDGEIQNKHLLYTYITVTTSSHFFSKALECHLVICVLNIEDVFATSYLAPD